jgi:hypothetical protein
MGWESPSLRLWSEGSDHDVAVESPFGSEVGFGELVPLVTGHERDKEDSMMHTAIEKC